LKTIDIHAHIVPDSMWRAIEAKQDWHGFHHEPGEGSGTMVANGQRTEFSSAKLRYTVEQRIKDMDEQKVDVQVLSIHTPFVGYHLEPAQGLALARDFNDELSATVRRANGRLAGFATLPVQEVGLAIAELERAVTTLGLKGASLDTSVNGLQWDEPAFLPFFKAAEQLGAVLFYHPQPRNNFLQKRISRHGLNNSLGVILDDAIVTAVLLAGGVLEMPRRQNLHRPRRRTGLPCHGPHRQELAGLAFNAQHGAAAGRLCEQAVLRHRRRRGPCGDGQRLALRAVASVAGEMAARS